MNTLLEWEAEKLINAATATVQEASKAGAEMVRDRAKQILDSNTPGSSGKLSSEIEIKESLFKEDGGGYLVEAQGKGNYSRFYALFVEVTGAWIHPYGNQKLPKVFVQPQPYLRPALHASKKAIQGLFNKNKLKE